MIECNSFFELLKVAIRNTNKLSVTPSEEEWLFIYDLTRRHSLSGITFAGIERLEAALRPPRMLLLQWAGACEKIIEKNKIITDKCFQVSKWFDIKGFESCILKGQSNNNNYPDWLKEKRNPGDIDIWVWPTKHTKQKVKTIVDFCNTVGNIDLLCYHHADLVLSSGEEIEVHFRPSWLSSPFINKRLQEWFEKEKESIKTFNEARKGTFPIPTPYFNVVYQLLHIYRHLFDEGVGLRQIIDYYFVLEKYHNTKSEDEEDLLKLLKRFNLLSFAGAMMYVLRNALNMPEAYMICESDDKRGKHLLNEIMIAGNFGWYDERINRYHEIKGLGKVNSILKEGHNFFNKNKRNLKMLMLYPSEVLWTPYFMIYHWLWRKLKLWRF